MSNKSTQPSPSGLIVSHAWSDVIAALGYNRDDQHLVGSPDRVGRFMSSWHTKGRQPPRMTTFAVETDDPGIVSVNGIQFYSLCAHHGLPFFGKASIAYIPDRLLVGLSKFARVVDYFAHQFQTQEVLGDQIATFLQDALQPKGLVVQLRAEHLCMAMRGVERPGAVTVTSSLRGTFRIDASARAEVMELLK